jgi:hypothetical protein
VALADLEALCTTRRAETIAIRPLADAGHAENTFSETRNRRSLPEGWTAVFTLKVLANFVV